MQPSMILDHAVRGALAAALLAAAVQAGAATTYNSRASFEATLGAHITDDYEAAGYLAGDKLHVDNVFDIFTDAGMSAVFGQTRYQSTGFSNLNIIEQFTADADYCAGCNGSFILDFGFTTYGTANGVFGVGFDYSSSGGYVLFITYGDGSTENIVMADAGFAPNTFFGLTSDLLIRSIAVGGAGGATRQDGSFALDDLTIGSEATTLPTPATLALAGLGLLAAAGFGRRRAAVSTTA